MHYPLKFDFVFTSATLKLGNFMQIRASLGIWDFHFENVDNLVQFHLSSIFF